MKISEKFKKLTFKDKIDYLWDYYKIPIIGVITLVALIIYIFYLVFRHVPEEVLNVTLINSSLTSEDEISLDDDFLRMEGYDLEDYKISMDGHITIDNNMSGNAREFVAAMILAEEIDVLVWDEEAYEYVNSLGAITNLEDYMTVNYIEKYSEYAIYENEILIGFRFNETKNISKELKMGEIYVGIINTATRKDEGVRFIEYLLDSNYGGEN